MARFILDVGNLDAEGISEVSAQSDALMRRIGINSIHGIDQPNNIPLAHHQ